MTKAKRYNPLLMLFNLWKLVRNSIFFVFYLFVINAGSDSTFITYGRIIFYVAFGLSFISIILKWLTSKYELDDKSFHFYKGVFSKSERTIPFSKIQNVNRHTSLFHQIFKMTSVNFETGMAGEDGTIKFEVISQKEVERMEGHISRSVHEQLAPIHDNDHTDVSSSEVEVKTETLNRIIHFKPTNKDTLKASFTSLSFLVLIPLLGSLYFKINEIFHVEEEAEGIFTSIISSWWFVSIIIIVLVIASTAFGIVRTFIKYGKYEISSDEDRIYIKKGVIDEAAFSIAKEKVQAIEIKQSLLKRLLGLAEVKLTSAGGLGLGENSQEINTLYPFLPVKRAQKIISEILPSYEVTENMERLPKASFWIRMLKPSWLWIIATAGLFYYKPPILEVEQAWWILSVILFVLILVTRLLDYFNTRYTIHNHFIQFKKGSLSTTLFVSRRDKIIEVKVTRGIIQKALGLASIGTVNRARPVQHTGVDDVPIELADAFYKWYIGRRNEIELE